MIGKLEVSKELAKHVPQVWKGWRIDTIELLMSITGAHICGIGRPQRVGILSGDVAFREISRLKAVPSQSTRSRLLSRAGMEVAKGIMKTNKALLIKVRNLGEAKAVTFDPDKHVMTCYGKQQRAAKGYNQKKRGRKAYRPMLCFIGATRDLVHAVMRGGKDCHIGKSEPVSFVREALGGLPIKGCLVRVRADSGFYNHEFLEYLDSKVHQYAVVARWRPLVGRG